MNKIQWSARPIGGGKSTITARLGNVTAVQQSSVEAVEVFGVVRYMAYELLGGLDGTRSYFLPVDSWGLEERNK